MKNKILAFVLMLTIAFSAVAFPVMATEEPELNAPAENVLYQPAGRTQLNHGALRPIANENFSEELFANYKGNVISKNLSASKIIGPNASVNPDLGTDLANYQPLWADINNGISFIGATGVGATESANAKGSLNKLVDDSWDSKSSWQCAIIDVDMTARYNVNGQFDTDADTTNDDDFRYIAMLTFNFGKVKQIEALSYLTNNVNNVPSAADIYVSNDGENWTLVDYYDRLEGRANLTSYENSNSTAYDSITTNSGDYLWKDGGNRSVKAWWIFHLTNVQQAQYIRVAYTVGYTNIDDATVDPEKWGFNYIKTFEDEALRKEYAYTVGKGALASQWVLPEVMVHGSDADATVSATDVQMKDNADDATAFDARFVVDVKDYFVNDENAKQINFKISAVYEGEDGEDKTVDEKTYFTNYVTTSIKAAGKPVNAAAGSKFALFEIIGIPKNVKVTFTVTPEVEYRNGAKMTGQAMTFSPNGAYTPDVTE